MTSPAAMHDTERRGGGTLRVEEGVVVVVWAAVVASSGFAVIRAKASGSPTASAHRRRPACVAIRVPTTSHLRLDGPASPPQAQWLSAMRDAQEAERDLLREARDGFHARL